VTPLRRRYRTDLTDAAWQVLAPLIPAPKPVGAPLSTSVASSSTPCCTGFVGLRLATAAA
jgi:transposase